MDWLRCGGCGLLLLALLGLGGCANKEVPPDKAPVPLPKDPVIMGGEKQQPSATEGTPPAEAAEKMDFD